MTNTLKNDIINSFVTNILMQMLFDDDADMYLNGDIFEDVTKWFDDCGYNKIERSDKVENALFYEDEIYDNVINGCGEYWRDEYGIFDLNDHLEGDEIEKAMAIIREKLAI